MTPILESDRVMTRSTHKALVERKKLLQEQQAGVGVGSEGASARAQGHDSAALIYARQDLSRQIDEIGDLDHVVFIDPPHQPIQANLGTQVLIEFNDGTPESGILLGPDDFKLRGPGVISYKSPIGRAILDKPPGSTAKIRIGDTEHQVTLICVEPWKEQLEDKKLNSPGKS